MIGVVVRVHRQNQQKERFQHVLTIATKHQAELWERRSIRGREKVLNPRPISIQIPEGNDADARSPPMHDHLRVLRPRFDARQIQNEHLHQWPRGWSIVNNLLPHHLLHHHEEQAADRCLRLLRRRFSLLGHPYLRVGSRRLKP